MAKAVVKKKSSKKKDNKKRTIIKIIFILVCFLIIIGILISSKFIFNDKVVITIDGIEYKETDFNMYAYLVKYEYFGADNTEVSTDTLNTLVDNNSDTTVGEYLKDKTITKIKIAAAILRIADENNITLDSTDEKEILEEQDEFISSLGGNDLYEEMLKNNKTTNSAYLKVAQINKLYEKIYTELYSEGKINDLSDEEKEEAHLDYYNEYVKFKQIILLKKDLSSNTSYNDIILRQKEALATYLLEEIKSGDIDFSEAVINYSEDDLEEASSEYYKLETLKSEIYDIVINLEIGDISKVISTDDAFHIILLEELDDGEFVSYLNELREEKFIEEISLYLDKISIIKSTYLESICVE